MSSPAKSHGAAEAGGRRQVIGIHGLDRLREVVSGADIEFQQLTTGRLRTKLTRVVAGSVTFDANRFSLPLRAVGRGGVDTVSFVLLRTPVTFNGTPLNTGDLVLFPPGSDFDAFSKGAFSDYVFTLRPDALARFAAAVGSEADLRLTTRFAKLRCTQKVTRRLVALGASLEADAVDPAQGPISVASGVLSCLCDALTPRGRPEGPAPASDRRSRLVSVAERYLTDERHDEITLDSICRALDVSARTLQVAFRSVAGVGPCEYDRIRRLHAARRDLLSGKPKIRVSDVALSHGFLHFGRFSAYYRELFEELPSATLRRSTLEKSGADRRTSAVPLM